MPYQVYCDMCDATGIMCHDTILDFFERARSAGLGGYAEHHMLLLHLKQCISCWHTGQKYSQNAKHRTVWFLLSLVWTTLTTNWAMVRSRRSTATVWRWIPSHTQHNLNAVHSLAPSPNLPSFGTGPQRRRAQVPRRMHYFSPAAVARRYSGTRRWCASCGGCCVRVFDQRGNKEAVPDSSVAEAATHAASCAMS